MIDKYHKKKFKTNKAIFEVKDNILKKEYFKTGDAARDFKLLKEVQRQYQPQKLNSWFYRPLEVYCNPTANSIEMEYIPCETIRKVFSINRKPQLYYHMGKWLGILHRSTEKSEFTRVIAFRDFSDVNFLLDLNEKVAVAIDPGNYKKMLNHPSISIMTGAFSIQRGVLKVSNNYIKVWLSLYYYLFGYLKGCGRQSLPLLDKGIKEVSKRQKVFWHIKKKMPFKEKVVRTGELILLIVNIKFISSFLRIKMRTH